MLFLTKPGLQTLLVKICITYLLISPASFVQATDVKIEQWALPQTQKPNEEFLLYRLSYSGLLTAFVWKDIADTVIIADAEPYQFNTRKSCRLHLRMSTENFSISEFFSAMRYHWRSTVSPDLSHIFLIEEINENKDQIHEVVWLDTENNQLEIYHRRKKVESTVEDNYEDDFDDDSDTIVTMKWEQDNSRPAPNYLVNKPMIDDKLNYLVHDKTVKFIDNTPIYDPLSLIYSVRWHDYQQDKIIDYVITHEDSFRKYRAHYVGKEKLEVGEKLVDTIKVEIKRNHEDTKNNKGYMHIWLSDDQRRIPLQYLVEAKVGEVRLKINTQNFENYKMPVNCIIR